MQTLGLQLDPTHALHVLCVGAHCDDIEIGCGGTILTLTRVVPRLTIHWVVFSATPEREHEARTSARAFLAGAADTTIHIYHLRDGFFPYQGQEAKECFEGLKQTINPAVIFTHYQHDRHQDHRMISELTWNTFRNHLILEYEIPKYDGDFGSPNVFLPISTEIRQTKIEYLLEFFPTQRHKPWFSADLFSALLRLRGMEANSPTHYAEAFYARKLCLALSGDLKSPLV